MRIFSRKSIRLLLSCGERAGIGFERNRTYLLESCVLLDGNASQPGKSALNRLGELMPLFRLAASELR